MDSGVLVRVGNGSRTEYAVYSKEIVNTCIIITFGGINGKASIYQCRLFCI